MAITNYAELQTAIANYLHRADLTTAIPDFISIAESKLNRRLRIRAMENLATGTVASAIALPTGFLAMKALTVTSGGTTYPLTYITPNEIVGDTATARYYSIIGDDLYFEPVGAGETYSLLYYKKFDPVSAGANWLITNAPEVYLYAALLEASPYIDDMQKMQIWAGLLDASLAQLESADRDDRYGSALVVTTA
jgi:hypothetical protein